MIHPHVNRRWLEPTPSAIDLVRAVEPLTASATGKISGDDAQFLLSLIELARPRHLLEVGVASGTSTLMMLRMIERGLPGAMLDSVDLATAYYVDPSKPVAYLVHESYDAIPDGWRLFTGAGTMNFVDDDRLAWDDLRRRYDFVFIDAHHGHPWPALDALCLLPYTVPGSWIAFHDINLPLLGDYPDFGPSYVIEAWTHDVAIGGTPALPNIGAIRLSDAACDDAETLIATLDRPWDCRLDRPLAARIFSHLRTFLDPRQLDAVRRHLERHGGVAGS